MSGQAVVISGVAVNVSTGSGVSGSAVAVSGTAVIADDGKSANINVEAKKIGTSTISVVVTGEDGREYPGTLTIKVVPKPTLTVTGSAAAIQVGKELELTPVISDEGDYKIEWTSSNRKIASVADGVVTGLKPGAVTITATLKTNDVDRKVADTATYNVDVTRAQYSVSLAAATGCDKADGKIQSKAGENIFIPLPADLISSLKDGSAITVTTNFTYSETKGLRYYITSASDATADRICDIGWLVEDGASAVSPKVDTFMMSKDCGEGYGILIKGKDHTAAMTAGLTINSINIEVQHIGQYYVDEDGYTVLDLYNLREGNAAVYDEMAESVTTDGNITFVDFKLPTALADKLIPMFKATGKTRNLKIDVEIEGDYTEDADSAGTYRYGVVQNIGSWNLSELKADLAIAPGTAITLPSDSSIGQGPKERVYDENASDKNLYFRITGNSSGVKCPKGIHITKIRLKLSEIVNWDFPVDEPPFTAEDGYGIISGYDEMTGWLEALISQFQGGIIKFDEVYDKIEIVYSCSSDVAVYLFDDDMTDGIADASSGWPPTAPGQHDEGSMTTDQTTYSREPGYGIRGVKFVNVASAQAVELNIKSIKLIKTY